MKKVSSILIGLLVVISIGFKIYRRANPTPSIEKQLVKFAKEMNKTLPNEIEPGVIADKIKVGPGKNVQFNFILKDVDLKDVDVKEYKKALREGLEKSMDTDPNIKIFKKNKIDLKYCYYTTDKKLIAEIKFDF